MLNLLKQKFNTLSKWGVKDLIKVRTMISKEEKFSQSKEILSYYKIYKEKTKNKLPFYNLSILIPTRNEKYIKSIVSELIKLLKNSTEIKFEIIILNNFNQEIKRNIFEPNADISIINCDFPFNFSKINNLGVKSSKYDTLWFLNDDIRLDHFSIKNLLSMLNISHDSKVGAVGNILLYPDGRIQHGGVSQRYWIGGTHIFRFQNPKDPKSLAFEWVKENHIVDAVTGASLLIEKKKFLHVGSFNEELPVDFNDLQLCKDLRNINLNNIVKNATIIHLESKSRKVLEMVNTDQDFVKNARVFLKQIQSNKNIQDPS